MADIEYDENQDRHYIPLADGWEIQTRGNGSSFRIAKAGQPNRYLVIDEKLHEPLEAMARAANSEIERLRSELENARQNAVLTIAFLGRDRGTDRQHVALDGIAQSAVDLDRRIQKTLSVENAAGERCQFSECRSAEPATIHVNESIDDGSWRIGLCSRCASITGLADGDDIADGHKVNTDLRAAYASVRHGPAPASDPTAETPENTD